VIVRRVRTTAATVVVVLCTFTLVGPTYVYDARAESHVQGAGVAPDGSLHKDSCDPRDGAGGISCRYDGAVNLARSSARPSGYRLAPRAPVGALDDASRAAFSASDNIDGAPVLFEWDANGNQLAKGTSTYAYDAENRLVTGSGAGAASAYTYNGDGVRVGKVVTTTGTTTTSYGVDTIAELPVVLEDGEQRYVHGLGLVASIDQSGDALYHLADALGSTMLLTDADGEVQQQNEYDAFGLLRSQSGGAATEFTFTGEQFDAEAELVFLRARYYDPATGRFLTRDPFPGVPELPAAYAPYAYALNNPVLLTDPSGEIPPLIVLVLIGAQVYMTYLDYAEAREAWQDPCATWMDRSTATGWLVLGIVDPTKVSRIGRLSRWAARFADAQSAALRWARGAWRADAIVPRGAPRLLGPGTTFGAKIEGQLANRGWTKRLVQSSIDDPVRTVATRDNRYLPGGGRLDDPATAYYNRRGGYVVRNDRTGDIVQVSDRTDAAWRAPWDRH
jgi:RHS repeat-associated protein